VYVQNTLTCGDAVEPPIGIEPMTYSLRVETSPSIAVRGRSVRSALLSGAHVRVITQSTPSEPVGGIGALCRYAAP